MVLRVGRQLAAAAIAEILTNLLQRLRAGTRRGRCLKQIEGGRRRSNDVSEVRSPGSGVGSERLRDSARVAWPRAAARATELVLVRRTTGLVQALRRLRRPGRLKTWRRSHRSRFAAIKTLNAEFLVELKPSL